MNKFSLVFLLVVNLSYVYGANMQSIANKKATEQYLYQHVTELSVHIGERNVWRYDNLLRASNYIQQYLQTLGYKVALQKYTSNDKAVENIAAIKPGFSHPEKIIIIGAHYDSVHGTTGADDNASGVAALLEIARLLAPQHYTCTIQFVAFVNEEPPFSFTPAMGSYHYAERAKQQHENIIAMFSLETLGYYSQRKNSQSYPTNILRLHYPNKGNFIGFVGNFSSRHLVNTSVELFKKYSKFPIESISAPASIPGISWSDHASFWQQGYHALMVTDTALFRNPYYHTVDDTIDKLDLNATSEVVIALSKLFADLASECE